MTPAWPPYADPAGLWFNTTDIDAAGQVMAGGTFKFDTTGAFGTVVMNAQGAVLLNDVWDPPATDGVFWVKLSPDGSIVASGGWQTMDSASGTYVGRLRVLRVTDGAVLLDQATGSRVNQIAMSADARWLVAGCGATYSGSGQQIYLYKRVDDRYVALGGYSNPSASVQTLAMSDDGKWITAGLYGSPSVLLLQNIDNMLVTYAQWDIPATQAAAGAEPDALDVRRGVRLHREALARHAGEKAAASGSSGAYTKFVSITPDGSAMVAALSGRNGVACFARDSFIAGKLPEWIFAPGSISTSSNVAIAADGSFVVLGSNGDSTLGPAVGVVTRIDNAGDHGVQAWRTLVEYFPNPCNRMLGAGDQRVAFGTGEPSGDTLTPGRFYALDAVSGAILGVYPTSAMNWPFQMSADGSFAIGGSDDGHLYGFNAWKNWDNAI